MLFGVFACFSYSSVNTTIDPTVLYMHQTFPSRIITSSSFTAAIITSDVGPRKETESQSSCFAY